MNKIALLSLGFILSVFVLIEVRKYEQEQESAFEEFETESEEKYEGPKQFLEFHRAIRTGEGETEPGYETNYQWKELQKAIRLSAAARTTSANGVLEWKERGPGNVPGRTRGIIVDPDDATHRTWYAGSATGGIWKTIDGGSSWQWLTPNISNLATSTLAMAESNHNVIYAGSGEGFGLLGGVIGSGVFKSTNRGNTWTLLTSTESFDEVNRIIISPTDENLVLVATNGGIYRTTNGGISWTKVYSAVIQDLKATPGNFAIQYATQNRLGVIKSTDGGITWSPSKLGMSTNGRVEIAISPVKTDRIFASAQGTLSGTSSDLYFSDDGGSTWLLVDLKLSSKTVNYLGDQGWYNNTVACDPYDKNKVYIGGVGAYRVQIDGSATGTAVGSYSIQENGTTFLSLITATGFNYGTFAAGASANKTNVEIRFGSGLSQKAHRFLVPDGATSGVPDANYAYQNYVDVPFQVWDVSASPNRQLMVSFRDQDRNGSFNLNVANTSGAAIEQTREYVFIHNIAYDGAASPSVAVAGGQIVQQMYNFWPVLSDGSTWNPNSLPTSNLKIIYTEVTKLASTVTSMSDSYNEYDSKNNSSLVHPDQHNIVIIKESESNQTFRMLMANDGGIYSTGISTTPGVQQGDWSKIGNGYNTSQFYGVDKKPGADEYIGGMQDNATYFSPAGVSASATTSYGTANVLGGDGFEAVWNNLDPKKIIGGAQNNNFARTLDGGASWARSISGLTLSGSSIDAAKFPFVSKLANSKQAPDVLFTVGSEGVWRSENFGGTWALTPITQKWALASFSDVEVSRANANIIWAGTGMNSALNIHVSKDGGKTFTPTTNTLTIGGITKLASHPTEAQTAYALFSVAKRPKILRTKDLGQTWQDISGFGSGSVSTTGFPDVAVYCLYVRPDNADIIWAGTEIGIVESLDGGASWNILNDFPHVAVWDMKGQDDQIVIATHGRGIWTAKLPTSQLAGKNPVISAAGTNPKGLFVFKLLLEELYDSTHVLINTQKIGKLNKLPVGESLISISGIAPSTIEVKVVSFRGGAPIHSAPYLADHILTKPVGTQYYNYFSGTEDFVVSGFSAQSSGGSVNKSLQSPHPYISNRVNTALLKQPIKITDEHPFFFYRDIALIEPTKDYVVVEATKDGITWSPIAPAYDASSNASWSTAFTSNTTPTEALFVDHDVNLKNKFNAGDTLLFRFKMYSNADITGWGWSVDDLYIQQKPTGLNKESARTLSIYPNPSSGIMNIHYSVRQSSDVAIHIVDQSGKVYHQSIERSVSPGEYQKEIDLTSSPSGLYLVKVSKADGTEVKKVVIRR